MSWTRLDDGDAARLGQKQRRSSCGAGPGAAAEADPGAGPAGQLAAIERDAILKCLREHEFNRSETARALGISRRTLTYRLREYRDLGLSVDPE